MFTFKSLDRNGTTLLHKLTLSFKKKNVVAFGENTGISNACTRKSLTGANLYPYHNYKSHIKNKTNLQIFNIV
jgi:hypothetical protein